MKLWVINTKKKEKTLQERYLYKLFIFMILTRFIL